MPRFFLAASFLLLLGLGCRSPQTEPTALSPEAGIEIQTPEVLAALPADWNTYESREMGVAFSFPPQVRVEKMEEPGIFLLEGEETTPVMGMSLEDEQPEDLQARMESGLELLSAEDVSLPGLSGRRLVFRRNGSTTEDSSFVFYLFFMGEKTIVVAEWEGMPWESFQAVAESLRLISSAGVGE